MTRARKYQLTALALLGAMLLLGLATLPYTMVSTGIVGMAGKLDGRELLVQAVEADSPAALAGVRTGDRIVAIDGRPISRWHQLYRTRLSAYLAERRAWDGRPVPIAVSRDGASQTLVLAPRRLGVAEITAYFGPSVAIIVILASLTIFILVSNPKDTTAHLTAICFSLFIGSISAAKPAWPEFLSPLFPTYGATTFLLHELVFTFGIHVVISVLFHLMLIFPRNLLSRRRLNAVLPVVYVVPSATIAAILLMGSEGSLVDRMQSVYVARLGLDSGLLVLAPIVFFVNYRGQNTKIQEEQARWIIRAVVAFVAVHVGLWNVPKLVIGTPLLPSYNWILLSFLLIPVALTASIANHHLFGIRGLIRRRMAYLDTLLQRQRHAVERRDDLIRSLTEEIDQLRDELDQYVVSEDLAPASPASDRLQRLEYEYPAIREARESHLLGRSPVWERVFAHALLAAKGDMPVLITGESGTGKTQLARTIAALTGRPHDAYREISCAQFEHADPAFALGKLFGVGTGHGLPNTLRSGQPGLLEECDGGVLFMDDFDCLPPNAQDLLLYPLEGKPFEPGIGSGAPRSVSLKFILATNRDVDELVDQGKLRADVVARVGARVHIPPLRERTEDIPLLVQHLLSSLGDEFDHQVDAISPKAMNILNSRSYRKGNVRQLRAELRMAIGKASLEDDPVLRAGYLADELHDEAASGRSADGRERRSARAAYAALAPGDEAGPQESGDSARELAALRRHAFHIRKAETDLGLSHKSKTLTNHLRGRCIQALVDNDWDIDAAARALAGTDDARVLARLQGKMTRYLASIRRSVADGTEQRLFNNLPSAYHAALSRAIGHVSE